MLWGKSICLRVYLVFGVEAVQPVFKHVLAPLRHQILHVKRIPPVDYVVPAIPVHLQLVSPNQPVQILILVLMLQLLPLCV